MKIDSMSESNDPANKMLFVAGLGSGHGVGMSQWGARYMARRGLKAEDILNYYYTEVKIKPFFNIYR